MRSSTCPNPERFSEYLAGQLQLEETTEIDAHIAECRHCQKRIASSETMIGNQASVVDDSRSDDLVEKAPNVLGKYELVKLIGKGGMGQVFKARQSHLDKVVALKLLDPDKLDSPQAVSRFRREIEAISKLNHPHIVKALDAGTVDGTPYLAMEWIEGETLADLVTRRGPLPVREACELIHQAALGLGYAHENNIIHRDVKPSNLIVSGGVLKVLDLGLALSATDQQSPDATHETKILGTADFISPEQANQSHTVGVQTDIYSLGCTLYFLLAGHAPFSDRKSKVEKLMAHQFDEPVSLRRLRRDLPPRLADLVEAMMAKKSEDRPATMMDVANKLVPYATGKVRWGLKRGLAVVVALVVVAVFAGIGVYQSQTRKNPDQFGVEDNRNDPPVVADTRSSFDLLDPKNIPTHERFDWHPKELVAVLGEHRGRLWIPATTAAFSSDGKKIATAGDRLLQLWDSTTLQELALWKIPTSHNSNGPVTSLCFSPDGTQLITADGGIGTAAYSTVRVWDITGKSPVEINQIPATKPQINSMLFTDDGKTLVTASGQNDQPGEVILWNLSEKKRLKELPGHTKSVRSIAYNSLAKRLGTACDDGKTRFWNLSKPDPVLESEIDHPSAVRLIAFIPDRKQWLSMTVDKLDLQMWELEKQNRKLIETLKGVRIRVDQIAISPDAKNVLCACDYDAIRYWVLTNNEPPVSGHLVIGGSWRGWGGVIAIAFDAKRFATVGTTIRLCEFEPGEPSENSPPEAHRGPVKDILIPADGKSAISIDDQFTQSWQLEKRGIDRNNVLSPTGLTYLKGQSLIHNRTQFAATALNPNPNIQNDFSLYAQKLPEFELVQSIKLNKQTLGDTGRHAISPDAKWLAVDFRLELKLYFLEGESFQLKHTIKGNKNSISGFKFLNDSKSLLLCFHNEKSLMCDLEKLTEKPLPDDLPGGAYAFAIAPKSNTIVYGGGHCGIGIFDPKTGSPIQQFEGNRTNLWKVGVAISPDEKLVAWAGYSSTEGRVRVYDCETNTLLYDWKFPGTTTAVAFTEDGRHLLVGAANSIIYVLRLAKIGTD